MLFRSPFSYNEPFGYRTHIHHLNTGHVREPNAYCSRLVRYSDGYCIALISDDDDDFQVDDEGKPIRKSARVSLRGRRKRRTAAVKDDPEHVGRVDCRTCKLDFWSAASRRTHEEVHQEETSCAACDKVFSHPVLLAEHIKRSHTQHEVMQETEMVEDLSSERNHPESEVDAVIRELGIAEMEAGASNERPQGKANSNMTSRSNGLK